MRVCLPIAALLGLLGGALAESAGAGDAVPVRASVRAGHLTVGHPGAVAVPRLRPRHDGRSSATVTVPVTLTDARGSGAGWALVVSAVIRTAEGERARGVAASLWAVTVRCAACRPPRERGELPIAVSAGHAVRALSARPGSGMGTMRLLAEIRLTGRPAARGSYVLVPTISRIAGP